MAVTKYRSFWEIDGVGGDTPEDMTPDTTGFQPPDVARAIVVLQSGKYFNERVHGRLEDMQTTVILSSNFHAVGEIGKEYTFDVEEELIDNLGNEEKTVTYSVVGKLQNHSPGNMSHDNLSLIHI